MMIEINLMQEIHNVKDEDDRKLTTVKNTKDESDKGKEGELTTIIPKDLTERPSRYKVIIHNDDYTTMEFVIHVLQTVFHKNSQEAKDVMLEIHKNGFGICGVYTYEIAETKMFKVIRMAKDNGHPLQCTLEKE